jgi:uncharacterized protein (DUF362 family)
MSKVAIVDVKENAQEALSQAFKLIGTIEDLNNAKRTVVIKVGVFDHKAPRANYSTVSVVGAIVNSFTKALRIYLAESDNYKGTGLERLQIWKELFTDRVVPFKYKRS